MDIGSGNGYPASSLSNFAPHKFVFDGVECNSMEGLLQSFKFQNHDIQVEVCKLVGRKAKLKGRGKKWFRTQTLYWKGVEYPRASKEYQELLDRAFEALSMNSNFRKALLATGNACLTHSLGKSNMSDTILTRHEFCSRLMKIRLNLQKVKS